MTMTVDYVKKILEELERLTRDHTSFEFDLALDTFLEARGEERVDIDRDVDDDE